MSEQQAREPIVVRLDDNFLDKIEDYKNKHFGKNASRATAMRSLMEKGLDNAPLERKILKMQKAVERLTHTTEMIYQLAYMTRSALYERVVFANREMGSPEVMEAIKDWNGKANTMLIRTLVERTGDSKNERVRYSGFETVDLTLRLEMIQAELEKRKSHELAKLLIKQRSDKRKTEESKEATNGNSQ